MPMARRMPPSIRGVSGSESYYYAVQSLAIQADGRILVGGSFTMLGGQARNNLGRLDPDGSLIPRSTPGPVEIPTMATAMFTRCSYNRMARSSSEAALRIWPASRVSASGDLTTHIPRLKICPSMAQPSPGCGAGPAQKSGARFLKPPPMVLVDQFGDRDTHSGWMAVKRRFSADKRHHSCSRFCHGWER